MTFDTLHQAFKDAKDKSDKEVQSALTALEREFVRVKEAFRSDPTADNKAVKDKAAAEFQAARKAARASRPVEHQVGGDFRGFQADAFLPDDKGGNTALALQLLTGLFAERGDTASDPAAVLAEMRAGL